MGCNVGWSVLSAKKSMISISIGGWGGIRTPGGREPTPVFKTGALNHSATHPCLQHQALSIPATPVQSQNCHRIATGTTEARRQLPLRLGDSVLQCIGRTTCATLPAN